MIKSNTAFGLSQLCLKNYYVGKDFIKLLNIDDKTNVLLNVVIEC